jgi:hypothetical protein
VSRDASRVPIAAPLFIHSFCLDGHRERRVGVKVAPLPGDTKLSLTALAERPVCADCVEEVREQMHLANAIIVDRKKEPEMATLLPAMPITPRYAAIKRAVVDFADDGNCDYYLPTMKAIWRMVLSASSKAAAPPVSNHT